MDQYNSFLCEIENLVNIIEPGFLLVSLQHGIVPLYLKCPHRPEAKQDKQNSRAQLSGREREQ